MKKILSFALMLFFSAMVYAQGTPDFPYEKVRDMNQEKLTVKDLGNESFVLMTPGDDTKRFFATNLPDIYKKDGLMLVCSGIIGKVPPNFRMIGTPLKLTTVKVGKNYKKYKIKVKSFVFE
jgi:hypothetical protein